MTKRKPSLGSSSLAGIKRYYDQKAQAYRLPIQGISQEFLERYDTNEVTLLEALDHCGRSTQVPQWCLYTRNPSEASKIARRVMVVEPSGSTAYHLATQVVKEMHVKLGDTVGFSAWCQLPRHHAGVRIPSVICCQCCATLPARLQ